GYIVVSSRIFDCVFAPSSGAPPQFYQANISRFGAQIGFTNEVGLAWAVFAATSRVRPGALAGGFVGASGGGPLRRAAAPRAGPGALAGGFVGASAGAAIGVGVGANGLVGGLDNSFALQPISVEG